MNIPTILFGMEIYKSNEENSEMVKKFCEDRCKIEKSKVDKINFITHKDDLKMKKEDLKVGTVLKQFGVYYRIFKIVKEAQHSYFFEKMYDEYIFDCDSYSLFALNDMGFKIVDKVPAKIEEVEEEVPVYVGNEDYESLKNSGLSIRIHCSAYKDVFHDPIELCKIKRTVKKELNFSWEKNLWE